MIKRGTYFSYLIYIDANHVMIGPPDLQHYITIGWKNLDMFSSLNFMLTVKKTKHFHTFFGLKLITSQPEMTTSMLFLVPEGIIGVFVANMEYFTKCISLFHFYELVDNCKS